MKDKFQTGSGTYVCGDCGKQTRETGYGESESGLCACCFRVAEWENALSDGHIDEAEFERVMEEIKKEYNGKKLKNFPEKTYNKKENVMNTDQLRKAAADLNKTLGLEPKIDTRLAKEELTKKVSKAGAMLEDGDKIEQNTFDVLAELEVDIPAGVKKVKAQKAEKDSGKEGKPKASQKKAEPGKPGVIATILEIVKAASKDKPVTSEQILKKLEKAFPEKDPNSMMNTIKVQLPGRMSREKNINILKDEEKGGFYVK